MRFTARIGLGLLFISVGAFLLVFLFKVKSSNNYPDTEKLMLIRKNKDLFLKTSPLSPIPERQRSSFQGLHYFPPTNEFRLPAYYESITDSVTELLGNVSFQVAGYILFSYKGKKYRLKAYYENDSTLFVPFSDETNGISTYEGGRYLHIPLPSPQEKNFHIDFNYAFFPYCAYNPDYICPKIPPENHLPIAITAGERY